MPEVVISNTSPIFYLHRLRLLDLLQELYQKIIVPKAVVAELETGRRQGEDVPEIDNYEWIETRAVRSPQILGLSTDFGSGETEVLALALEVSEILVIIDEKLARKIARLRGLRVTGTAGVLLKAKQEGHIRAIKPFLDRLQEIHFHLSDNVRTLILSKAGE
ncbi:MAG: DUF3368 domain-containing protein [Gemmatimonadetes bacterium]|nr:DUF3368 domain-containing protein [Gemmatimonadota bacterium]